MPRQLKIVFGMLLLGIVVRFYYLVPALLAGQSDFSIMQQVCIFILSLGVVKGFDDRSVVAWKTARVMTLLFLLFTLIGTVVVTLLAFSVEGLAPMAILSALVTLLNLYVVWVLHSKPVKAYFENQ